jgi:hypothetical protein
MATAETAAPTRAARTPSASPRPSSAPDDNSVSLGQEMMVTPISPTTTALQRKMRTVSPKTSALSMTTISGWA